MRVQTWFRRAASRTRLGVAALAAVVVFVAIQGFAASLGTASAGLGAGSELVTACGTGMSMSYSTSFYGAVSGYAIDGIDLSDIPSACLGKNISVTFVDRADDAVGSPVTGTLPAAGTTDRIVIAPGANTVALDEVGGVSVVVW